MLGAKESNCFKHQDKVLGFGGDRLGSLALLDYITQTPDL